MAAVKSPARPNLGADPVVFPPYYVRRFIAQLFSPAIFRVLTPTAMPSVALPSWLKTVFWVLLFANWRSLPLVWHFRVFYGAVAARAVARPSIHPLLPWIKSNKYATTSPGVVPRLRLDKLPLGRDIFNDREITVMRAMPDDCDWNLHMSNSCYPKNLDYTRMAFLASRFLRSHFDGGHFALGGTSFTWHAELPFMSKYEVEISIGGWDDKWLYVVGRFTSKGHTPSLVKRSKSAQNLRALMSDVVRPAHEVEKLAKEGKMPSQQLKKDLESEANKAKLERKLYCTSISRYCFKSGRKTIPPWFVIATSGYGTYASTRTNWDKAENLRRNVLKRCRAEYLEDRGKPMPCDSLVMGSGYRRGGILANFDPSRPEGHQSDDQLGLGAWQDQENWHMAEWEERRVEGLKAIKTLGGLASTRSDTLTAAHVLGPSGRAVE